MNNYARYTPTDKTRIYKLSSNSKNVQTFLFIVATLSNGEILYLVYNSVQCRYTAVQHQYEQITTIQNNVKPYGPVPSNGFIRHNYGSFVNTTLVMHNDVHVRVSLCLCCDDHLKCKMYMYK